MRKLAKTGIVVAIILQLFFAGVSLPESPIRNARRDTGNPGELTSDFLQEPPKSGEHVRASLVRSIAHGETAAVLILQVQGSVFAGLESIVKGLGGLLLWSDEHSGLAAVSVPIDKALSLGQIPGIDLLSVDRSISLPTSPLEPPPIGAMVSQDLEAAPALPREPDLSASLAEIRADELMSVTGVDGNGITIAIIDTGIDPGHAGLSLTNHGTPKVVDWQDFTGRGRIRERAAGAAGTFPAEGDVATRYLATIRNGKILTSRGQLGVAGVRSLSGILHYGFFAESQLSAREYVELDLNRDGTKGSEYIVVVADSRTRGVYDTVYIDLNKDGNLGDERPMQPFKQSFDVGWFGQGDGRTTVGSLAFVVTDVSPDGNLVNLGFDGNGHGSHVAGVAAGYEPGRFRGVAPGARLMALKALNSSGDGTWASISEAIVYAARNGAQLISISVGGLLDTTGEFTEESRLISSISRQYNVLIILAVGNNGPGIATGHTPGDPQTSLAVGAYASSESWRRYYGYNVLGEGLWYFSAAGPRIDGSLSPNLVAPGSALSTVPTWYKPEGYDLFQGTSMAVPFVAGGAALILEAVAQNGLVLPRGALKRSLELSARRIEGFLPAEQGYGVLDLYSAWKVLKGMRAGATIKASFHSNTRGQATGLYSRDSAPGWLPVRFTNDEGSSYRLIFPDASESVKPDRNNLLLPPRATRTVFLRYNFPRIPGVYSEFLSLTGSGLLGGSQDFLQTVVVPYELSDETWSLSFVGEAAPARWQRYFLRVPSGAGLLSLHLQVPPDSSLLPSGRVALYAYRPDGKLLLVSNYVGRDPSGSTFDFSRTLESPDPGVWELVVYSSASLSSYGLRKSEFMLDVQVGGVRFEREDWRIHVPAGSGQVRKSFSVRTYGTVIQGQVMAASVSRIPLSETHKLLTLGAGQPVYEEIEVPEGTLLLQVKTKNPSQVDADLDLFLYRFDPAADDFEAVGTSNRPSTSSESVAIENPRPGKYIAWVEGFNLVESRLRFEFETLMFGDEGLVTVEEKRKEGNPGASGPQEAVLVVTEPAAPGEYPGYLLFKTMEGQVLAVQPFVVVKGQPSWELVAEGHHLVERQPGFVTLRAIRNGVPDDSDLLIEINGRLYYMKAGRLTLPVTPDTPVLTLFVKVRTQPVSDQFAIVLPVAPADRPGLPAEGVYSQEMRRKLLWEIEGGLVEGN